MPEEMGEKMDAEVKKKGLRVKVGIAVGIAVAAVAIVVALFATHTICFHEWDEASCTVPKSCSICGATEGDSLGHDPGAWQMVSEATCTSAGVKEAQCVRCGETVTAEIPMLEHTPGEWSVAQDYRIESDGSVTPGLEVQVCAVCGGEIDSRDYTVELTTGQKNAVVAAYDDVNFWHPSPDFLVHDVLVGFGGFTYEDASFAVEHIDVDWDEQAVLYAKQHATGESRAGLADQMRYMKFTEEQIEAALAEVGY